MRSLCLLVLLAAPAAAADAVEDRLAGQADLFYGLHFTQALGAARAAEKAAPGHPVGPFFASVVRFQELMAGDVRSTEAFSGFEAEAARAEAEAEAWRPSSASTAEYYLGAVHGFRARALYASRGVMAAVGEARRGYLHLRRALELDPSREEAKLGLGIYDYYISQAPSLARPLAFLLFGALGNRARGLSELKRASETSGAAQVEARTALAAVYGSDREARWQEAEELLAPLVERYPGNPLFRLRRAYVTLRRGRAADVAAQVDPDGAWLAQVPAALRPMAHAAALYRAAEGELLVGRRKEAGGFLAKMEGLPLPPGLGDWADRRRAQVLSGKDPSGAVWPPSWPPTGLPD